MWPWLPGGLPLDAFSESSHGPTPGMCCRRPLLPKGRRSSRARQVSGTVHKAAPRSNHLPGVAQKGETAQLQWKSVPSIPASGSWEGLKERGPRPFLPKGAERARGAASPAWAFSRAVAVARARPPSESRTELIRWPFVERV